MNDHWREGSTIGAIYRIGETFYSQYRSGSGHETRMERLPNRSWRCPRCGAVRSRAGKITGDGGLSRHLAFRYKGETVRRVTVGFGHECPNPYQIIGSLVLCHEHSGDCFNEFLPLERAEDGRIRPVPEWSFGAYTLNPDDLITTIPRREFHLLLAGETVILDIPGHFVKENGQ